MKKMTEKDSVRGYQLQTIQRQLKTFLFDRSTLWQFIYFALVIRLLTYLLTYFVHHVYTVTRSCWRSWYMSSTTMCLTCWWQTWCVLATPCGISRQRFVQLRPTKTLPAEGICRRTWASSLMQYGLTRKQTPCLAAELHFLAMTRSWWVLSVDENTVTSKTQRRNLATLITITTTDRSSVMSLNIFSSESHSGAVFVLADCCSCWSPVRLLTSNKNPDFRRCRCNLLQALNALEQGIVTCVNLCVNMLNARYGGTYYHSEYWSTAVLLFWP